MPSRTAALAAALACALALAAGPAAAQQRDFIRIVGSSTVFPFATTVAEVFGRHTAFRTPVVEATGTGGGINLFCQGLGPRYPDLVDASRRIKPSELDACRRNGVAAVAEIRIGFDGIVLTASRKAGPLDLTRAQLWLALARQVPRDGRLVDNPYRTWNEIDPALPATPIEVYGPPPTSGTRDAFVELVMEEGCKGFDAIGALPEEQHKQVCQQVREDGVFIEAGENDNLIVQKLTANPEARGLFGFSFLDQNRDRLQAASIGGVEPTFEAISDGRYPVSRSLYVYVKTAHVGSVPGIREFLGEFTSARAAGPDGYLADKGLIPLPEEQRETERRAVAELPPVNR